MLRRDEDGAELAPQPALGRRRRCSSALRADGLDVELRVEGEASALPTGVDLAAYRLIQQALDGGSRRRRATARG